jgi:iron(III) transport system substrate-binding protein
MAILIFAATTALAAGAAMSPAQLALYQGADREKILVAGAKKEGQLTLYDSHTWFKTYVKDFEKKYPFITVSEWRNDSKNVLRRAMEEFNSSRAYCRRHRNYLRGHGGHEAGRRVSRILYPRSASLA